jgi:hypothetical protein
VRHELFVAAERLLRLRRVDLLAEALLEVLEALLQRVAGGFPRGLRARHPLALAQLAQEVGTLLQRFADSGDRCELLHRCGAGGSRVFRRAVDDAAHELPGACAGRGRRRRRRTRFGYVRTLIGLHRAAGRVDERVERFAGQVRASTDHACGVTHRGERTARGGASSRGVRDAPRLVRRDAERLGLAQRELHGGVLDVLLRALGQAFADERVADVRRQARRDGLGQGLLARALDRAEARHVERGEDRRGRGSVREHALLLLGRLRLLHALVVRVAEVEQGRRRGRAQRLAEATRAARERRTGRHRAKLRRVAHRGVAEEAGQITEPVHVAQAVDRARLLDLALCFRVVDTGRAPQRLVDVHRAHGLRRAGERVLHHAAGLGDPRAERGDRRRRAGGCQLVVAHAALVRRARLFVRRRRVRLRARQRWRNRRARGVLQRSLTGSGPVGDQIEKAGH